MPAVRDAVREREAAKLHVTTLKAERGWCKSMATQPLVVDADAHDVINLVSDSEDNACGDVGRGALLLAHVATTVRHAAPLLAGGLTLGEQKLVRTRTERLEDLIGYVVVGNFDNRRTTILDLLSGDNIGVAGASPNARASGDISLGGARQLCIGRCAAGCPS